jgi:ribosomal protein S18 acetylase RimI-like enzyme
MPLQLCRAEPGDEQAVAAVHVCSWQVGYRGLLPRPYLDGLRAADRAARYTFGERWPETVLAVDDERVVGFATVGPAREDDSAGRGELWSLYVHPDRWGEGIGRALLRDARERLVAAGFGSALLWVLSGNDRAVRCYVADGWRPDGGSRQEELWSVLVDEVRYRRRL